METQKMNAYRLTLVAFAACFLLGIQGLRPPEGMAQIGGKSGPATFRAIEAPAFLLKNENGEIVGGLTTGLGRETYLFPWLEEALRGHPGLFLVHDGAEVNMNITGGGNAIFTVASHTGPRVSISVGSGGALMVVDGAQHSSAKKTQVVVRTLNDRGEEKAEVEIYSPERATVTTKSESTSKSEQR